MTSAAGPIRALEMDTSEGDEGTFSVVWLFIRLICLRLADIFLVFRSGHHMHDDLIPSPRAQGLSPVPDGACNSVLD